MKDEVILGVWDGHDAGVAVVQGDRVLCALNEERFTRRKLEVGFPGQSLQRAFQISGLKPVDISGVAFSTTDPAKTLSRIFPSLKENYYRLRRRKSGPGTLVSLKKWAKFRLTELRPNALSRGASRLLLRRHLQRAEVRSELITVGHHEAHLAGAAYCSGFDRALVVSLDGIGDGLSGSFSVLENGRLRPLATLEGRTSFGIFFEQVTHLANMRELEDEGKIMALANYSSPVEDRQNPMLDFFRVDGLQVKGRYSVSRMYQELKAILWRTPLEQFAYMAQRTLELRVTELIQNALALSGCSKIAYSGGVAANIKINRLIRELPGVDDLFVFPHMGDGGQALGAAMVANSARNGVTRYLFSNASLGPSFSDAEIEAALRQGGFLFERVAGPAKKAAELIASGEIVGWFQGRMEYGPRALGSRSILALPGSLAVKDRLNLSLKKRVWYQPFCPSLLEPEANEYLQGYSNEAGPSSAAFMTRAFRVKSESLTQLAGVTAIDGTCRPQVLSDQDSGPFSQLLHELRERTGMGVVLNTSFNRHGEPLVCSPEDALRTFSNIDISNLIIGEFWVRKV